MKAVWYERVGPAAEVLRRGELPDPEPGRFAPRSTSMMRAEDRKPKTDHFSSVSTPPSGIARPESRHSTAAWKPWLSA